MGFRFRRIFRLAPGVRLNVAKTGPSLSFGRRGLSLNISRRGIKRTVGLPGSGLSYTSISSLHAAPTTAQTTAPQALTVPLQLDLARFGIEPKAIPESAGLYKRRVVAWSGFLIAIAGFFLPAPVPFGVVALGVLTVIAAYALVPTKAILESREQARCQALARAGLQNRLKQFATAAQVINRQSGLEDFRRVLALQQQLGLTDNEIGQDLAASLRGIAAFFEFKAAYRDGIAPIHGHEQITGPDNPCYFVCEQVKHGSNATDPAGTLYLTKGKIMLVASDGLTAIPWAKVISFKVDGMECRVQRRDRQHPSVFRLPSLADALKADFVATQLLAAVHPPAA
jgi:hypothetical protein